MEHGVWSREQGAGSREQGAELAGEDLGSRTGGDTAPWGLDGYRRDFDSKLHALDEGAVTELAKRGGEGGGLVVDPAGSDLEGVFDRSRLSQLIHLPLVLGLGLGSG